MVFDIERLRLPSRLVFTPQAKPRVHLPHHKPGEWFLKGPIPWRWVEVAASQPGRALHVGLVLWLHAGIEKSARVALNMSRLRCLGVDRYAASRGLRALETAGLVRVDRHQGRKGIVQLLDPPARAD